MVDALPHLYGTHGVLAFDGCISPHACTGPAGRPDSTADDGRNRLERNA